MDNNKKGKISAGLILGIISIIISGFGYLLGVVGFFCYCISFIVGVIGVIFEIVHNKKNGKIDTLGIIGIIVGIIAIIVAVVGFSNALSLFMELKNSGEIG